MTHAKTQSRNSYLVPNVPLGTHCSEEEGHNNVKQEIAAGTFPNRVWERDAIRRLLDFFLFFLLHIDTKRTRRHDCPSSEGTPTGFLVFFEDMDTL